MGPAVLPLACTIVTQIPALLDRLAKYDEQNDALTLQCESLEREIEYLRGSIEVERRKQDTTRARIYETGEDRCIPEKSRKRQRVTSENDDSSALDILINEGHSIGLLDKDVETLVTANTDHMELQYSPLTGFESFSSDESSRKENA